MELLDTAQAGVRCIGTLPSNSAVYTETRVPRITYMHYQSIYRLSEMGVSVPSFLGITYGVECVHNIECTGSVLGL